MGMLHSSKHLIHMVVLVGSAKRVVKNEEREEVACLIVSIVGREESYMS